MEWGDKWLSLQILIPRTSFPNCGRNQCADCAQLFKVGEPSEMPFWNKRLERRIKQEITAVNIPKEMCSCARLFCHLECCENCAGGWAKHCTIVRMKNGVQKTNNVLLKHTLAFYGILLVPVARFTAAAVCLLRDGQHHSKDVFFGSNVVLTLVSGLILVLFLSWCWDLDLSVACQNEINK